MCYEFHFSARNEHEKNLHSGNVLRFILNIGVFQFDIAVA